MLGLAVKPPQKARVGVALYPPIAARIRSEASIFEELSQFWAVATLVYDTGEVLNNQLGGTVVDSAHPLPESTHGSSSSSSSSSSEKKDRAYFYFPDLTIRSPGRYCIRVSLMQMDYSSDASPEGEAVVREYIDSPWIDINDGETATFKPNKRERAFLRVLKKDGQQVPSAPA